MASTTKGLFGRGLGTSYNVRGLISRGLFGGVAAQVTDTWDAIRGRSYVGSRTGGWVILIAAALGAF